jgi:predicted RNase H-like HicB family nuclease
VISLIEEAIQFHLEDLKMIDDAVPQPASKSIYNLPNSTLKQRQSATIFKK